MTFTRRAASAAVSALLCFALPTQSFAIMCGGWLPQMGFAAPPGTLAMDIRQYAELQQTFNGQSFGPADYDIDCGTGYQIERLCTARDEGQRCIAWKTTDACRVNRAPTVDMSFIGQMQAQGYTVNIGFPFADAGTGRAFATWAKPCPTPFACACPPSLVPSLGPGNMCGAVRGFARVEGAGWLNQYGPQQSSFGGTIPTYAAPDQPDATVVWGYGAMPGLNNDNGACFYGSAALAAVLLDPWLQQPPTPPGPPLPPPPAVPPTTAPDVAFGFSGSGAATGSTSTGGAQTGRGSVPFDFVAYCSAPDPSGTSRTPAWIANCLRMSQ